MTEPAGRHARGDAHTTSAAGINFPCDHGSADPLQHHVAGEPAASRPRVSRSNPVDERRLASIPPWGPGCSRTSTTAATPRGTYRHAAIHATWTIGLSPHDSFQSGQATSDDRSPSARLPFHLRPKGARCPCHGRRKCHCPVANSGPWTKVRTRLEHCPPRPIKRGSDPTVCASGEGLVPAWAKGESTANDWTPRQPSPTRSWERQRPEHEHRVGFSFCDQATRASP